MILSMGAQRRNRLTTREGKIMLSSEKNPTFGVIWLKPFAAYSRYVI